MADQIKELIEKINQEGIQAAQEKAREIEDLAQQKAEMIIRKADAGAKKITEDAQDKVNRLQESSQAALKQAARDLLLSLKKEIIALLGRLMTKDISAALTPEELSRIIAGVIQEYCGQGNKEVIIYLKEPDKNKLEGHFLNKLKDELKKGIELRQQEDIHAGFIISFDSGKSHFDFSDKALAQYLGTYLKPKVAELFKDTK
jgi:V/A-type H+-transporting ATPase subunit E